MGTPQGATLAESGKLHAVSIRLWCAFRLEVSYVTKGSAMDYNVRLWSCSPVSPPEFLIDENFVHSFLSAHLSERQYSHNMDHSMMSTEETALAPPSQLPKRASASTDHSNSVAANTGSNVSANEPPSIGQGPQSTADFYPMEMEAPDDESDTQHTGSSTELR